MRKSNHEPSISESRAPSVLAPCQPALNRALKSAKRSPLKPQHFSLPHLSPDWSTPTRTSVSTGIPWTRPHSQEHCPGPKQQGSGGGGGRATTSGVTHPHSQSHGTEREGEKHGLEVYQRQTNLALASNIQGEDQLLAWWPSSWESLIQPVRLWRQAEKTS